MAQHAKFVRVRGISPLKRTLSVPVDPRGTEYGVCDLDIADCHQQISFFLDSTRTGLTAYVFGAV